MTDVSKDLADLRRDYRSRPLRRTDLDSDPIVQFDRWFQDALQAAVPEPNAMSIATVDAAGQPSSRTVLLKFYDQRGLVFYTNLGSRKAREIETNPKVALLFFWPELQRQVKVRGTATRASAAETLGYFIRRPRESQLGAWASAQSTVIPGREALEARLDAARARFGDGEVPCPPEWGGYRLVPDHVELWQGRPSRLHDRLRYTRKGAGGAVGSWLVERLSP